MQGARVRVDASAKSGVALALGAELPPLEVRRRAMQAPLRKHAFTAARVEAAESRRGRVACEDEEEESSEKEAKQGKQASDQIVSIIREKRMAARPGNGIAPCTLSRSLVRSFFLLRASREALHKLITGGAAEQFATHAEDWSSCSSTAILSAAAEELGKLAQQRAYRENTGNTVRDWNASRADLQESLKLSRRRQFPR